MVVEGIEIEDAMMSDRGWVMAGIFILLQRFLCSLLLSGVLPCFDTLKTQVSQIESIKQKETTTEINTFNENNSNTF